MQIVISNRRDIESNDIIALYKANQWSASEKPKELYNALTNPHSLISAWDKEKLVGIGNAISDGYLLFTTHTCLFIRIIKEWVLDKRLSISCRKNINITICRC